MFRQILQIVMFIALLASFVMAVCALKHGSIAFGYASVGLFLSLIPMGFMHDVLRILERIETALNDKGE